MTRRLRLPLNGDILATLPVTDIAHVVMEVKTMRKVHEHMRTTSARRQEYLNQYRLRKYEEERKEIPLSDRERRIVRRLEEQCGTTANENEENATEPK